MPLIIVRNDITKMEVDAIVNAANNSLLGGGGVNGAIHAAAGPRLLTECRTLGGCETGQAKITKAYNLKSKYVIHTVGPVWNRGNKEEEKLLADSYKNSLQLAIDNNLESVAFPLISTGAFKLPIDNAINIATTVIRNFLIEHEMTIYLVVYDRKSLIISQDLFEDVSQYIDDNYVDQHTSPSRITLLNSEHRNSYSIPPIRKKPDSSITERNLENMLLDIEDTFSERLLKLIDIKGYTDVETYKKANIDRRLFSKIKGSKNYRPKKQTVIAFCLALELNIDETKDFLLTAGYALSNSSQFDLIIRYHIDNEIYDVYEVNQSLFHFNQNLLGVE